MSTFDRVVALFTQETDIPGDDITPATSFRSFGELDSLDFAEWFMEVEEEYRVELPDRVCCGFETFRDVVDEVDRQVAARG